MSDEKATASKAKNTKAADKAATAADQKAAAEGAKVTCTVLINGSKINGFRKAEGRTVPLDPGAAELLEKKGIVKIG